MAFTLRLALDGVAVAVLFEDHVRPELNSGQLVRVLKDYCSPFPGFHLYSPGRAHTPLKMRVSSVTRGADGVARVDWSRGSGMTARTAASTVTIPTGLIANGESVVMSEATYDYDSPVDYMMPSITQFSQSFYLRPRSVEKILYTP